MKLLFLALSQRGYGETVIGMSLARQLLPLGVRSHFVVEASAEHLLHHSGFAYSVISAEMGPLAGLVIDDIVSTVEPDAFVLSDYVIYTRTMRSAFGLDPWFIDRYGLPIVPIDIWELDGRDLSIDFGGQAGPPIHPRIRQLAGHLQPVPMARPQPRGGGQAHPFRLSAMDGKISRRTREHLFTTFGIPRGHRLALVTFAAWQESPDARYDERFHRIARRVPLLLAHYLRSLPATTHFLLVGNALETLRGLPADRTVVLPSCSPKRFGVLVGAADLVISLNAASTSVAEAVMADVPAMVLSNRFAIAEADMLEEVAGGFESGQASEFVRSWLGGTGPIYPFRIWPLGYHRFLEPLLAGNPYADALATAELLDEHGAVTVLEAALYDQATRDSYARARADYHRTVAALPDTCETFTRAAQAAGLSMR
jgi:hypothetical protein